MGTVRRDEPSGRGAEHELEQLAALAAHLQTPALLVDGEHGAELEATAEVRDARGSADAR